MTGKGAILLIGLCLLLVCGRSPAAAKPPNIVVILTDDQGIGDLSAGGATDIRTPNIDRIFREGMTFANFYANSCVCSPTRAALLTGCQPDRVGVPGVIREQQPAHSWGFLAPDARLLPQVLTTVGYHSTLIGKWHLGLSSPNLPTERGFDFFSGFLDDMMDDYWTHARFGKVMMRRNLEEVRPQGHATDIFSDWACAYLEERAQVGGPFLLVLAFNAPHTPIQPPVDWLERVVSRSPAMKEPRARLVALVEHLDAGIGRVLDTLDETGLANDTLLIFTSDNGGLIEAGSHNGPWRGGKMQMYEGGLRVPGAVRWPGITAAGSRTDRIALTMDIFPTACAAAGATPPAGIDGISFLPTIRGQAEPLSERDCYFVRREGLATQGGKTIEAFRRGRWKLVQNTAYEPLELFDLEADPRESTNLAAEHPKILAELRLAMSRQIQRGGLAPWQRPLSVGCASDGKP